MELGGYPIVTLLPPAQHLPNDHHVGPSSAIALGTAAAKPKYFQNPWKSYRAPSLNDAWLAYQKGAAIALPLKDELLHRHQHGEEEEEEFDEQTPLAVEPSTSQQARSGGVWATGRSTFGSIYVRPEFASLQDESETDDWRDPPVEVVESEWDEEGHVGDVTWLGHASVLVRIPWKTVDRKKREGSCGVLFDPIFSYRCSPSQYVGPARYLPPPCSIADLPPIHVCLISHDHYDHLDYYTIIDLWKYNESTIHFVVPMGLKAWFTASGIPEPRVTEMDWWHETLLTFPFPPTQIPLSSPNPPEQSLHYPPLETSVTPKIDPNAALTLKIAFTPAQHRSGRGVFDHMTTLWGSWCIGVVDSSSADKAHLPGMKDWKGFKAFFGGDTGYRYATAPENDQDAICPAFEQIASLYSPFSLSLLPLSTGSSLPFLRTVLSLSLDQYTLTSSQHCSPDDALEIHRVLGCERSLGIHWGTFCDSDEARGTRVSFGRGRRTRGIAGVWEGEDEVAEKNGRFVVSDIGRTLRL